jgi:proteasome lid subunit RPN8/RPN11
MSEASSRRLPGIRPDSLEVMLRHSRESYPDECCGVVVDLADGSQSVVVLRNVQDEMHAKDPARYPRTARTAYSPHAGDFKRAHDLWDAAGNRLVAFYHSHPDHGSYFSDEDLAQATPFGEPSYPDALQIVVSVYDREVRDVKAFCWSESEAAFVETRTAEA